MLLGNNLEILTSYFPFILQTSARYLMVIPPCLCTILFLPSETRSSCYAECKICNFIIMKSLKKLRLLCWTCTQCWTIGCSSPNTLLVPVGQRNEEQRNWGRGYILDAVDFVWHKVAGWWTSWWPRSAILARCTIWERRARWLKAWVRLQSSGADMSWKQSRTVAGRQICIEIPAIDATRSLKCFFF